MSAFSGIEENNGYIINNSWILWNHEGIPESPEWLRYLIRMTLSLLGHCLTCTGLSGCVFLERNMPKLPQHIKCHCKKVYVSQSWVNMHLVANCAIDKFSKYIFSDKSNGKRKLFESLGYTIEDSNKLSIEYQKQALDQYLKGNYVLKNVDMNGQRIAIPINLGGKIFYSGWIVEPGGRLRNTTPFGGWINE